MKLRGDYVPQKSAKTYATRGGICPQILRISHEYHIKAFKIVKKNQLVTGQKLSLDVHRHHHKISPKKWHDKSTRQKNHKKKQRTSQNQKKHKINNPQNPRSRIRLF